MPNRLADSTSPYLLQHADNPVDWQEWGEEAFAEARRRDVPVLLSVGYAACHWCHVMAHETFEDEEVSAALNPHFVAIKVDREERPDVDAVYMSATTALTGHGGWPMTCVLTPDGEPFFAGTYFPRAQFLQLLAQVRTVWAEQRERVLESSAHIAGRLREMSSAATPAALDDRALAQAAAGLRRQFDDARGGFGGAPKFPPSMVLEFLLRHHARTGSADALAMVERTCTAMARGGMYDQLGGGFARYSVDADWVVPHFEKMLYDNAQLLRVYSHWMRATGDPLARRVAAETAEFLRRDLRTATGGFASALDADTDGVEGLTYAWTPQQLVQVLGEQNGTRAAELLSVTPGGTFEHGSSTLQLRTDPDDPQWWSGVRSRLLSARDERPQPARDDKVVTSWNGLAVAALADASLALGDPSLLELARRCAEFVVGTHLVDGRLRRSSRDGRVGAAAGVADDHGNLAEGLLALHQATGEARWLETARQLLEVAVEQFGAD
ncbi:MAG TPA: thioredoxin domain-containing protein, partial [Pedococcus sp.]|nr:thioredoxin domain-containing protein [Pedococcus sp.]